MINARDPEGTPESITLLIGRLDGKLDLLLVHRQEMDERLRALENRTGSLERWRSYTLGITAVTAIVVELLAHHLGVIG